MKEFYPEYFKLPAHERDRKFSQVFDEIVDSPEVLIFTFEQNECAKNVEWLLLAFKHCFEGKYLHPREWFIAFDEDRLIQDKKIYLKYFANDGDYKLSTTTRFQFGDKLKRFHSDYIESAFFMPDEIEDNLDAMIIESKNYSFDYFQYSTIKTEWQYILSLVPSIAMIYQFSETNMCDRHIIRYLRTTIHKHYHYCKDKFSSHYIRNIHCVYLDILLKLSIRTMNLNVNVNKSNDNIVTNTSTNLNKNKNTDINGNENCDYEYNSKQLVRVLDRVILPFCKLSIDSHVMFDENPNFDVDKHAQNEVRCPLEGNGDCQHLFIAIKFMCIFYFLTNDLKQLIKYITTYKTHVKINHCQIGNNVYGENQSCNHSENINTKRDLDFISQMQKFAQSPTYNNQGSNNSKTDEQIKLVIKHLEYDKHNRFQFDNPQPEIVASNCPVLKKMFLSKNQQLCNTNCNRDSDGNLSQDEQKAHNGSDGDDKSDEDDYDDYDGDYHKYYYGWRNLTLLKECHYCHEKSNKLKKCKKCLNAFYCSKICQKRDWNLNNHREKCCRVSAS